MVLMDLGPMEIERVNGHEISVYTDIYISMKLGQHHSEAYAAQCYVSIGAYEYSVLRQSRRVSSTSWSMVVLQ